MAHICMNMLLQKLHHPIGMWSFFREPEPMEKQQNYPKLPTILMGDKIANPPKRLRTRSIAGKTARHTAGKPWAEIGELFTFLRTSPAPCLI